jgi:hypothetical protein
MSKNDQSFYAPHLIMVARSAVSVKGKLCVKGMHFGGVSMRLNMTKTCLKMTNPFYAPHLIMVARSAVSVKGKLCVKGMQQS